MAYPFLVHVVYCRYDLLKEGGGGALAEDAVAADEGEEVSSLAELHHQGKGTLLLEHLVQLGDVGVVELAGYGDLRQQFLPVRFFL